MTTSNNNFHLVDLQTVIPTIKLDLRYATINNFTGKKIYSIAQCFLQESAALALKQVQEELALLGLSLKVFDGYRPLSVQYLFWQLVPDEHYVADPKKGSRHNRGCAVDVTCVKLDGTEILMPTDFDDFTERAHSDYMQLPAEAVKNRALLRTLMERYGFTVLVTEWWHFDYKGWEQYPVLDIACENL